MKHTGSCHCGDVHYEVEADIKDVVACNCSICSKKGYLLSFVPEANFTLIKGADAISDYQFGAHRIHHTFCQKCGVASFSRGAMPDGTKMIALNVRCIDAIDIAALAVNPFDGKSL